MRALLDSNVLARATRGKTSAAREVLLLLTQPPHTLITAAPLLAELARILQYPRVRALHGLDDTGIRTYLQAIQAGAVIVRPASPPPVRTQDPANDVVIAAAVAGGVEVLCTWDRHFFNTSVQAACAAHGIRVLKDVDLLRELRGPAAAPPGAP